jgi:hypothetical protein
VRLDQVQKAKLEVMESNFQSAGIGLDQFGVTGELWKSTVNSLTNGRSGELAIEVGYKMDEQFTEAFVSRGRLLA